MKEFTIKPNESNQRLDKYLKKLLPNATTSFLYKMLRKKNITLNGKKAAGNETLKKNDRVCVFFSDETFDKFAGNGEALLAQYHALKELTMNGLVIIYETEDILAANKPYNMLSQKASENDISANEYLLGYLIRTGRLSFEEYKTFRPSVCNRLDRNTTGLLLMGKTLNGLQELSKMLKERSVQKYYRAIVAGQISEASSLTGYLQKEEQTNTVQILKTTAEGASKIETAYRPIITGKDWTLLEVHLITGKTHQIRAHLSSIGHPIIGDFKYGDEQINRLYRDHLGIHHQLLHAYRLEFPDGTIVTAPLPSQMEAFLAENRET